MLYEVTRDDGTHTIFIFGGGPQPPPNPFDAAPYLPLLAQCDEFWNEVPELGPEVQALAMKYGIEPTAPLATWLNESDLARIDAAAEVTGVNRALLVPLRPWLAAQLLKMAHESQAGLQPSHSAEHVLTKEAERLGLTVNSEWPPPDGPLLAFWSMPRDAEVEYLRWILDAVEAGADATRDLARAWAKGDLLASDNETEAMRRDYPVFYERLIVDRNRAWIVRIQTMFANRRRAFIVMGGGHLVGDDGVISLLRGQGFTVTPRAV
jgi:uncharacterized protein YbaP (TraB family)